MSVGQNIYFVSVTTNNKTEILKNAVKSWYDEIVHMKTHIRKKYEE